MKMGISLRFYTMISISFCCSMLFKIWLHSGSVIEFVCRVYQSWMALFLVANLLLVLNFRHFLKMYNYFIQPLGVQEKQEIGNFTWLILIFIALSVINYSDDFLFHLLVTTNVADVVFLGFLIYIRVKYLASHPQYHRFEFHRNLYILQFSCVVACLLIYHQIQLYLEKVYNPFVSLISYVFICGLVYFLGSVVLHTLTFFDTDSSFQLTLELVLSGLFVFVSTYYFIEHLLFGQSPLHFGICCFIAYHEVIDNIETMRAQKKFLEFLRSIFRAPSKEDLERDNICIICRQKLDFEQSVCLPCGHCFHAQCIEAWAIAHSQCPTCLRGIDQFAK